MPLYEFQNKETGEIHEVFLKIAEKPQFVLDNPHLTPIISVAPPLCDSVRIGVKKVDVGFKDVLRQIHQRTPGSTLNTTAGI